ncbi:MAG: 50S ribosome-binding GTPase, partial [Campylobacter sp.]|nr:50S ribosome-binding GTPase [Campylobacter sp.]
MKKIILIGRPNVGKSSLFNRLANSRIAITSEVAGTTRDTNKTQVEIFDRNAILIDSGGLDNTTELFARVQEKTLQEAKNADIIVFMVDGKFMPDTKDRQIFYSLLKLEKPTALVINKIDGKKDEERSWEFNEFGSQSFNISVSHNSGIDELKSWIYKFLDDE